MRKWLAFCIDLNISSTLLIFSSTEQCMPRRALKYERTTRKCVSMCTFAFNRFFSLWFFCCKLLLWFFSSFSPFSSVSQMNSSILVVCVVYNNWKRKMYNKSRKKEHCSRNEFYSVMQHHQWLNASQQWKCYNDILSLFLLPVFCGSLTLYHILFSIPDIRQKFFLTNGTARLSFCYLKSMMKSIQTS